jgi:hypothetical protein
MQQDYQSLGAQGVNHLANKLVFALFNPSRPFFRLDATAETLSELMTGGLTQPQIQSIFSKAEREAIKTLMKRRLRANIVLAMKQLIVTGNTMFYAPEDGASVQVYNIRDYVVRRDLSGEVTLLITKDHKKKCTLPSDVRDQLADVDDNANVVLYTRVELVDDKYHMTQAVNSVMLESKGTYAKKDCPWITLTWNLPRGWQYGVGLVEEYAGTFASVSLLTEALVRAGVIAADVKFLVDPAGITDIAALNRAASGEYVPGREQDIQAIQLGKGQDLNTASALLEKLERRLGQAFLLGSAITRDAERVTAEEIRQQARELESSLGGVYSTLAEDFQTPLAYISLKDIDFKVDGKKIQPMVVTGMDSLQRDSDADSMLLFIQDLAALSQVPENLAIRLKEDPLVQLLAANRGIDHEQFLRSEKEVQQIQAQQMQAQQMQEQGAVQGVQQGVQ